MNKIAVFAPGNWAEGYDALQQTLACHHLNRGEFLCEAIAAYATPSFKSLSLADQLRERALKLFEYLSDPAIDVIWCLRGGYGTLQVLQALLQHHHTALARLFGLSKWVMGFSDCCHLLNWVASYGMVAIHGPVFSDLRQPLAQNPGCRLLLNRLQGGQSLTYRIPLQCLWGSSRVASMPVLGQVVGGNLSKLVEAFGYARYPGKKSAYVGRDCYPRPTENKAFYPLSEDLQASIRPDIKDRIVLLEDTEETSETVAHMLHYLLDSGCLRNIRALLFGRCTGIAEDTWLTFLNDWLEAYSGRITYPVFYISGVGHRGKNYPINFSGPVKLTCHEFVVQDNGTETMCL